MVWLWPRVSWSLAENLNRAWQLWQESKFWQDHKLTSTILTHTFCNGTQHQSKQLWQLVARHVLGLLRCPAEKRRRWILTPDAKGRRDREVESVALKRCVCLADTLSEDASIFYSFFPEFSGLVIFWTWSIRGLAGKRFASCCAWWKPRSIQNAVYLLYLFWSSGDVIVCLWGGTSPWTSWTGQRERELFLRPRPSLPLVLWRRRAQRHCFPKRNIPTVIFKHSMDTRNACWSGAVEGETLNWRLPLSFSDDQGVFEQNAPSPLWPRYQGPWRAEPSWSMLLQLSWYLIPF